VDATQKRTGIRAFPSFPGGLSPRALRRPLDGGRLGGEIVSVFLVVRGVLYGVWTE
jgi:hypothetical protein